MGLFDRVFGKTLYYPGCVNKFLAKDIQRRHEELLVKFKVDVVKYPELEVCCGRHALNYGFPDDFNELRRINSEMFKNQKISKIITGDPACYYTFKKHYEDIEVEHISQTILNNVKKLDRKYEGQSITFFDPCNPYKLKELYDHPRQILEGVGIHVVNLDPCREQSLCCGKALQHISPKVGKAMAEAVLKEVKTKKLITTSTDCYLQFKENNPQGIQIMEFTEVLV